MLGFGTRRRQHAQGKQQHMLWKEGVIMSGAPSYRGCQKHGCAFASVCTLSHATRSAWPRPRPCSTLTPAAPSRWWTCAATALSSPTPTPGRASMPTTSTSRWGGDTQAVAGTVPGARCQVPLQALSPAAALAPAAPGCWWHAAVLEGAGLTAPGVLCPIREQMSIAGRAASAMQEAKLKGGHH